jgi:hypothetical protein
MSTGTMIDRARAAVVAAWHQRDTDLARAKGARERELAARTAPCAAALEAFVQERARSGETGATIVTSWSEGKWATEALRVACAKHAPTREYLRRDVLAPRGVQSTGRDGEDTETLWWCPDLAYR